MTNSTPFELSLASNLEIERQRFANQWICRWHSISVVGEHVDVDDFRGGRIRIGGVGFEGQSQQLYWQALQRGIVIKAHDVMRSWETNTTKYPHKVKLEALDGTEGQLLSFAGALLDKAVVTDQRLRGRGFPDRVAKYNASREHAAVKSEIARLAASYRSLLILKGEGAPRRAAPNLRHSIFVSYATEADRALTNELVDRLEVAGMPCWIAPRDIPSGADWNAAIMSAIDACEAMILLVSDAALKSPFVKAEVQHAFERSKRVFPIRLADSVEAGQIDLRLKIVQHIDGRGEVQTIVASLLKSLC